MLEQNPGKNVALLFFPHDYIFVQLQFCHKPGIAVHTLPGVFNFVRECTDAPAKKRTSAFLHAFIYWCICSMPSLLRHRREQINVQGDVNIDNAVDWKKIVKCCLCICIFSELKCSLSLQPENISQYGVIQVWPLLLDSSELASSVQESRLLRMAGCSGCACGTAVFLLTSQISWLWEN